MMKQYYWIIKNGNRKWQEAEELEIALMSEYGVVSNKGKETTLPEEYIKIKCRMIHDVKHDGRHCARLVAGGHLTPIPFDSPYSGVLSLRGLRLLIFIGELNKLQKMER
jgi:hypothetical protein